MRILIVDDLGTNRLLLYHILKNSGFTDVVRAASAEEAFTALRLDNAGKAGSGIDLILMDIMMPGIDGIEACRRIKRNPKTRDIPVIMVTALTDRVSLQTAFEAGAMDYLTKPINRVELMARVRSALALKIEADHRKVVEGFIGSKTFSDDLTCVAVKLENDVPPVTARFELSSNLDQLRRVRQFIHRLCSHNRGSSLDEEATWQMALVIHETVANIIRHAYNGRTGRPIQIEASCFQDRLMIRICHYGTPFKPAASASLPDVLYSESGYGRFIIENFVDHIFYTADPNGRNCIILEKH